MITAVMTVTSCSFKGENPLDGKRIAFIGDSISYGTNWQGGYGKLIGEQYNMNVTNVSKGGATLADNVVLEYYSDSTLLTLMHDAEEKFKDLGWVEEKLTKGFKRLKKEVPTLFVPHFYAQIAALNQSVVVGDSILGFSIDKYMGADYPLYKRIYYDYQCRSMEPDRIVPDCFTFYLLSQYPLPWQPGRTLLDMIMHRGKINWIVAHILGYESFEKEMGYSEDEAEWCRKNKTSLWKTMVENGHLYATDPLVVRTYIRKDPFISIMGEKTPASIGVWMGILLIDEYMKKHPDMTIKDLLAKTDYHQMLAETDFKP